MLGATKGINQETFHEGLEAFSKLMVVGSPPTVTKEPKDDNVGRIVAIVVCAVVVLFVISALAFAFTRSKLPPCLGFLNRCSTFCASVD